jgi:hypothetical protein
MLGSLFHCCFLFHPQTCCALGDHTGFLKVQCVRIGAHCYAICSFKHIGLDQGSLLKKRIRSVSSHSFLKVRLVPLPTITCYFSCLSQQRPPASRLDRLPKKRFWEISSHGAVCLLREQIRYCCCDSQKHVFNKGTIRILDTVPLG